MAGVNIATIGAMFTPVHFEALVMHFKVGTVFDKTFCKDDFY